MMDNIKIIWNKEKEDFFILMVKYILEIGNKIKNKDLGSIFIKMEKYMKVVLSKFKKYNSI